MKDFLKKEEVNIFDLEKIGLGDLVKITQGKNQFTGTVEIVNKFYLELSVMVPQEKKRFKAAYFCNDIENISIEIIQRNIAELHDLVKN